jgi:hypothetical protein
MDNTLTIWAEIVTSSEPKESKIMKTWNSIWTAIHEFMNPPARDLRGAAILHSTLRYLENYGQGDNMDMVRARHIILYALYRVEAGL